MQILKTFLEQIVAGDEALGHRHDPADRRPIRPVTVEKRKRPVKGRRKRTKANVTTFVFVEDMLGTQDVSPAIFFSFFFLF